MRRRRSRLASPTYLGHTKIGRRKNQTSGRRRRRRRRSWQYHSRQLGLQKRNPLQNRRRNARQLQSWKRKGQKKKTDFSGCFRRRPQIRNRRLQRSNACKEATPAKKTEATPAKRPRLHKKPSNDVMTNGSKIRVSEPKMHHETICGNKSAKPGRGGGPERAQKTHVSLFMCI